MYKYSYHVDEWYRDAYNVSQAGLETLPITQTHYYQDIYIYPYTQLPQITFNTPTTFISLSYIPMKRTSHEHLNF